MTRVAVTVPREEIIFGADVEVQLAASLPKVKIFIILRRIRMLLMMIFREVIMTIIKVMKMLKTIKLTVERLEMMLNVGHLPLQQDQEAQYKVAHHLPL